MTKLSKIVGLLPKDKTYTSGMNNFIIEQIGEKEITLNREKLANIIQNSGADWENLDDPITPLYFYIADAIIAAEGDILECKKD